METISFACPYCKNLMAVGVNLLGRSVRCPTCRQVVQAPASPPGAAPAPPPAQAFQPPAFTPPVPPPYQPPQQQSQQPPPPPVQYAPPPVQYTPPPPPYQPQPVFQPPPPPQAVFTPPAPELPISAEVVDNPFPQLNLPVPPVECHESIFGEVVDEDLFGTKMPTPVMPPQPPIPEVNAGPLFPSPPAKYAPQPQPPAQPVYQPLPQPPVAAAPVFQPQPVYQPPQPAYQPTPPQQPAYQPPPQPAFPPPPPSDNPWGAAPSENPWGTPPPPQPAFQPQPPPMVEVDEAPSPPRTSRTPSRSAPAKSGGGLLTAVFALWALVATGAAVYALFFNDPKPPHPFDALPDLTGEFEPAKRKKVSERKWMPAFNADIPASLQTKLGTPIQVHDLTVTPLRIEQKNRPQIVVKGTDAGPPMSLNALAMTVKIKNNSDAAFHPVDPALQRHARTDDAAAIKPYAGIQAGKARIFGLFPWPPTKDMLVVAGRESDTEPLGPGEEREFMVFCRLERGDDSTVKGNSTAMWRLHLRTGSTEYNNTEFGITSVIGVPFAPTGEVTWAKK